MDAKRKRGSLHDFTARKWRIVPTSPRFECFPDGVPHIRYGIRMPGSSAGKSLALRAMSRTPFRRAEVQVIASGNVKRRS
jgi:hypothetical protein